MASTMAKAYARMIKAGTMSIEDVPERYRAEVEALLNPPPPVEEGK